jgi:glycine cleavage system transcriptional repressor
MPRFMVVAVGADRPGVVAALAGVLVELSCNLSDTQMAVLQGYASMMLVVDAPSSVSAEDLHARLVEGAEGLAQTIWVRPLSELPATEIPGRRWAVSVYGADRPGIVFEVARLLADAGINIMDLQTRMSGPVGSLSMEVDIPADVDVNELTARADRLGDRLGLSCSIRPVPPANDNRPRGTPGAGG